VRGKLRRGKMKKDFEKWMANTENKVPGTVVSYSAAINRISRHYSNEKGIHIDIYKIKDRGLLRKICRAYDRGGNFEDFGDEYNGLNRATIKAYVRYFEEIIGSDNSGFDEETNLSISDGKIAIKKDSTGKITISMSLQMEEE
jgi:hypothetical protein